MSTKPGIAPKAPAGPKMPAQGKDAAPAADAALGRASQNTPSPEGAKEDGKLRDGWRIAAFSEVVDILDSRRVPVNSEERANRFGDVPYYGATGQVGVIDQHIFDEELVLLGEDGAPFLDSRKPKAYLIRGKSWVNNHAHVLRGKPGLLNGFLLYQLNNLNYHPYVSGTTRLKLPQGPMKQIPLLVPPLPEQRRIVAEIEKQFTRLEAGVAALRRVQANLNRYRSAVLKAACEGRLVSTEAELARQEGRRFEAGEALLARILTERRLKWQGRGQYKEPAPSDTANLPPLPEGWTWTQFGHLGKDPFNTVQTGPFGAQLHNTEFTESGVPVIAVGNLTGTGFRTDGLYFVSDAKAKQLARYDVSAGDLLFARSGATLGKVCVAPEVVQGWRMTGHILRARLNQSFINPRIAVYALAALPAVRKQVFGNVRGVTRPGFNTGLLESIFIPVPPLAEQTRIVAEVERRLSVADELEAVVSANLQRASSLRQSILQKAFTGERVCL